MKPASASKPALFAGRMSPPASATPAARMVATSSDAWIACAQWARMWASSPALTAGGIASARSRKNGRNCPFLSMARSDSIATDIRAALGARAAPVAECADLVAPDFVAHVTRAKFTRALCSCGASGTATIVFCMIVSLRYGAIVAPGGFRAFDYSTLSCRSIGI